MSVTTARINIVKILLNVIDANQDPKQDKMSMKCKFVRQDNAVKDPIISAFLEDHPGGFIALNRGDIIYLQENSEIIGALNFEEADDDHPSPPYIWVDAFWIFDKNNRRKGYGTKLMKCFFERIIKIKKNVRLLPVQHEDAKKFFDKLHFKEIKDQQVEITFKDIIKYHLSEK